MKHNPADPKWPDRDRFVLSAGHASMLLYACLHLSGYDVTLDDLKQFRQLGSQHAGPSRVRRHAGRRDDDRPARPGLRQRGRDGDGREVPAREVRRRAPATTTSSRICSDGDLMEGVASEAASIAGHLRLGKCVFLYDDNSITIDGPTEPLVRRRRTSRSASRPTAGTRSTVDDGNDLEAIEAAIRAGMAEEDRPTLISLKTVIGYGSPRAGTRTAHSDPMPEDQVRATKEALGWSPDCARSYVPNEVAAHFDQRVARHGRAGRLAGAVRRLGARESRSSPPTGTTPGPASRRRASPRRSPRSTPARSRSRRARRAARSCRRSARIVPTMVGGAADLVHSTFTAVRGRRALHARARRPQRRLGRPRARDGRGGQRPRAARRDREAVLLDVLRLHRLHAPADPALGADGDRPRVDLQPRLGRGRRGRPDAPAGRAPRGDARDPRADRDPARPTRPRSSRPGARSSRTSTGPACLVLTRQDVPMLDRVDARRRPTGLRKGAYVLADADSPDVVLVATGAEVSTALGARDLLAGAGRPGARRLDAELGALRGAERRLPRRGASGRRAEDLGRGRRRRSAGRAGSTRRSGSTRSARRARAPRCSRTSGSARRPSPSSVQAKLAELAKARSEGHRRLHPGRAGRGAGRRSSSTSCARPRRSARRSPAATSSVICVGEVEDARALAGPGVALAGERHNVRIEGFDFGNSPREFAGEPHETTKLVLTTTNGTRALLAAAERCETVLVASLLNLDAVVEACARRRATSRSSAPGSRARSRSTTPTSPAGSPPRSAASPTTRPSRPPVSPARSRPPRRGSAAA